VNRKSPLYKKGVNKSCKGEIFMSLNSGQVKKLLETNKPLKFKQLSLSLMYTRLKNMYQKDPSPATISACMTQLNNLFAKFGATLSDDYKLATSV
jgi:hypothetical protein